MSSSLLTYVLITPARNEKDFIELTIRSVIKQTLRPARWVIVSDGSTDGTDAIVKKYSARHDWIELLRMPERKERHFGGKVTSFNAGYESVKHLKWDIIGSLDADLSFEDDYFAFLLERLAKSPRLGVCGTPFKEGGSMYDYRFSSTEHVSGACQLFRRECFEAIGGYTPVKGGGIDVIAVLMARMKGWETRTFPEKFCLHHRPMGSANHGPVASWFKLGEKDYRLGRHPLWQMFRSVYQMRQKPFVIGGCALWCGYFWLWVRRSQRPVSWELVQFQRREQMRRLRRFLVGGTDRAQKLPDSGLQLGSKAVEVQVQPSVRCCGHREVASDPGNATGAGAQVVDDSPVSLSTGSGSPCSL
jgi:poly-beta-1,6-N-acetyl-D-glucosamine synthase